MKDHRASYSNYGSVVVISAPGSYVTTALSGLSKDNAARFVGEAPYQYWYVSGTSIASPHVAGVAALMLSENPKLTNKQIKTLLINSSEALDTDQSIGGLVNAAAAVEAAKNF
jgi:serine protease